MNNQAFDVIVVGLGGVGSSAVCALSRRGLKVLGLDRYDPPHDRGSSHGETRIIRKAYFEHPAYVPLLLRSYELWEQLQAEVQSQLYFPTGLLEVGPGDGIVIPGVLRAAKQFGLPIEQMTMTETVKRFPMVRGRPEWIGLVEKDAGYLLVEKCIAAHLQVARQAGSVLLSNQRVVDWNTDATGVTLRTESERFHAKRLILAAGPWANEVLWKYKLPLRVLRKHLYWYQNPAATYREDRGFPCFFYETPEGYYYGFPQRDELGLKIARHSGGEEVATSPDGVHSIDRSDQELVERCLSLYLPDVGTLLSKTVGCYYTMTPDENFIVDRLPDNPNVTVVAGLSGHGFKFTSVLGEIAAELAMDGRSQLDVSFLSMSRFNLG